MQHRVSKYSLPFHQDDHPLAESIYPIANGQAVMTQIWPEGVATFRGGLDQDGGFTPVCGSFRAFRGESTPPGEKHREQ